MSWVIEAHSSGISSEKTKNALCFVRSSFEETEALVNAGAKIQHPVARGLAPSQEPHLQVPEKSSQKELEAMALGAASEAIEIVSGIGGVHSHWGWGPWPAGSPHQGSQALKATATWHPTPQTTDASLGSIPAITAMMRERLRSHQHGSGTLT